MSEKKIRLGLTHRDWVEVYGALGCIAGNLRDLASIQDLRPSEYQPRLTQIQALQDRIAEALSEKNDLLKEFER